MIESKYYVVIRSFFLVIIGVKKVFDEVSKIVLC